MHVCIDSPHWLVPITACWSSSAWPVFWFCVPTPDCLLQGGLESFPVCSQMWDSSDTASCTMESFTPLLHLFSPLAIIIIIALIMLPLKRDLQITHLIFVLALTYLQSLVHIQSSTGIYIKYFFQQDGSNRSHRIGPKLLLF